MKRSLPSSASASIFGMGTASISFSRIDTTVYEADDFFA